MRALTCRSRDTLGGRASGYGLAFETFYGQ
jgi:hypothetical protein